MKVKDYLFESAFFSQVFRHLKGIYRNIKKVNAFKILVPNGSIEEISDVLRIFGLKSISRDKNEIIFTAPQNRSYKVSKSGKDITIEIWKMGRSTI